MAHRYVFTQKHRLRGEAIVGEHLSDWFSITPELAQQMAAAPDYWIVYYQDDTTITDKASVLESAEENQLTEIETLQGWTGVQLVIVGD